MHGLKLALKTNHADGRYRRGEPIIFHPELSEGGAVRRAGIVDYRIFYDDDAPAASGSVDLADGLPAITAALDDPGFVQCQAVLRQPPAAAPVSAALGAAVEPEAIRPARGRPDDFDAFWQARLAELAKVPAEASLQAIACDYLMFYDIRVKCAGAPVAGYYAKPCAPAGQLPAFIHFQGAGVKSAYPDVPLIWASRGCLALCINAHGLPNGQPAGFYQDLAVGALADYRVHGLEDARAYYMLGMFLRVKRAIDFITAQPEWDGRHLVLHGHSQGAFQAIAGAYLDKRVSALAAGVPAGSGLHGSAGGHGAGWPKIAAAAHAPGRAPEKIMAAAPYFDNANFLAGVLCPAIFSVGWIDATCRPTGIYAALSNFKGNGTVLDRPAMIHSAPADIRAAFTAFAAAHLASCAKI